MRCCLYRIITSFLFFLIIFGVLPEKLLSWDLSLLKISPTYYASSIAVYKNRAFLALPRSSCYNNLSDPTLVEVPWFDEGKRGLFRKKKYPHYKEQRWGVCKDHQDVISMDLDAKKGKLWVLDKGNAKCPATLVIYNLYYNTIGQSAKLIDIPGFELNVLVLDPQGTRAYIGGAQNRILIYIARGFKLLQIDVSSASDRHLPISTNSLSISLLDSVLYMTGTRDYNLHAANLTTLRGYTGIDSKATSIEINAVTIGEKLGPSAGMLADSNGGLYYYLTRDYAIVKWNTSMPLLAEYHDVLMQTYDLLPFVSHIFYGPSSTIWALINPARFETCQPNDKSSPSIYTNLPRLKSRTVLIG